MNRKEIKEEAKAKIKGNIWNILWPMLVIGVVAAAFSGNIGRAQTINLEDLNEMMIQPRITIGSSLGAIISGILSAGYIMYLLNFVRTGKFNTNDIINTIKERWIDILIAVVLVGIIVAVCSILIIPGIIMALAYTFAIYLVVDKNVSGSDSLKESREMMKGYKWDYFVFELSFLGWIILGALTLGILYIWLIPYICVASCLYYEKLKEIKK